MKNIIEVKRLTKYYGKILAVDNIDFKVKEGEIFGFLGPNGAGKSTTINMLCTIIGKSSGELYVDGDDVFEKQDEVRKKIGIVFQERTLDEKLTASENLYIHGRLYHIPKKDIRERIDEVLEVVELSDRKKNLVSSFSGGMKRRLEIARGLMHYPRVLFLDEPTTGLDPQTRSHVWDYLLKLRKKHNMTIFLTTHYMDEAEICDRVAIIDYGEIVAYGTPLELKRKLATKIVRFRVDNTKNAVEMIGKLFGYKVHESEKKDMLEVEVEGKPTDFVVQFTRGYEGKISHLDIARPTLNDVFMNITGRNIRE